MAAKIAGVCALVVAIFLVVFALDGGRALKGGEHRQGAPFGPHSARHRNVGACPEGALACKENPR